MNIGTAHRLSTGVCVCSARARGAALPVALMYLMVLGTVCAVVIETASLQFRMAGNYQLTELALQSARAIGYEMAAGDGFDATVPVGHRLCAVNSTDSACDERTLDSSRAAEAAGLLRCSYSIIRTYPRVAAAVLPREREFQASSATQGRFAFFEVDVAVDAREQGRGGAHLVRGIALRLPSMPATGENW